MLTKDTILSKLARRTKTVASEVFGGDLCIREHTRAEFRAIQAAAALPPENGEPQINLDQWNGGLFANTVIDAATGAPLFTLDEILAFPERNALWSEVRRIAQESLDLSEVGSDALKSGDPTPDQG